jgi:hypothetical protein
LSILELTTNAGIVSDALKYVIQKTEQLNTLQNTDNKIEELEKKTRLQTEYFSGAELVKQMERIKTLIIERQCDDCNVGDRHEFHCLPHKKRDKKALAKCRQPLKCPACNSQIHTYTKEVFRNVPYFNKDTKPKTITVKRTCSGSGSDCGFSHKDEMPTR